VHRHIRKGSEQGVQYTYTPWHGNVLWKHGEARLEQAGG
jgi:hypothetical protein